MKKSVYIIQNKSKKKQCLTNIQAIVYVKIFILNRYVLFLILELICCPSEHLWCFLLAFFFFQTDQCVYKFTTNVYQQKKRLKSIYNQE